MTHFAQILTNTSDVCPDGIHIFTDHFHYPSNRLRFAAEYLYVVANAFHIFMHYCYAFEDSLHITANYSHVVAHFYDIPTKDGNVFFNVLCRCKFRDRADDMNTLTNMPCTYEGSISSRQSTVKPTHQKSFLDGHTYLLDETLQLLCVHVAGEKSLDPAAALDVTRFLRDPPPCAFRNISWTPGARERWEHSLRQRFHLLDGALRQWLALTTLNKALDDAQQGCNARFQHFHSLHVRPHRLQARGQFVRCDMRSQDVPGSSVGPRVRPIARC